MKSLLAVSLLGAALFALSPEDRLVLEDFEEGTKGELPPGWKTRGFEQGEKAPYRIEEENGNRRTITLSNIQFDVAPPAGFFVFTPPRGVTVGEPPR